MDVLRGFALMGILVINIQSFAMVLAALFNPTAYGDLTGLNRWVFQLSYTFGLFKFMAIFSMMFGAGVVLFTRKAEEKGLRSAALHYRRTIILLLFGVAHAYLLWSGDILVWYSLCALLMFLFRRLSPKKLLIIGMIFIAIPSLLMLMGGLSMSQWPDDSVQNLERDWLPSAEMVGREVAAYQGGWIEQMEHRVPMSLKLHTFVFFVWAFWRAGGLMLVGMAMFKWGVLTGERSGRFYLLMMLFGFVLGFPLVIYGLNSNFSAGWSVTYSKFLGTQFNYWGSVFVSLGYVGALMTLCKSALLQVLLRPLAAAGRMAFTNYLMQTIICTTIFYGHGFGLFGQVERSWQILIVFCVWIFQLTVSPIWLRYFRFGPFEWIWRSLTYKKPQPMRIRASG
jgi:uncharacterized protein